MANEKTLKKITLHPISNGQQDDSVDLLSKTSVNNILSGSIDVGGDTPFEAGYTKDLKYDKVEKERVIGVNLSDIPNWEEIQKLMPNWDYQQLYLNGEESIWLQCMSDASKELCWQLAVTLDDWSTQYVIFNRNVEIPNRSATDLITGNVWYYNGEISEKPEIELDINNIYNNNDELFYCVVDKETEKISVNRTLQEKNEDIANWQYYKETRYYTPEEYQTYPLSNELSQEYMASLISGILSHANSTSKYSNYMFGVDGYIMDTTQSDLSLWTFYNPTTTKWEVLNANFVGFDNEVPSSWYIHNSQIFYYNNRTFMAAGNGGMSISKCLVELSFDILTSTLTLTLHPISLGANENTIYARGVFEWDNKLLCKEYVNNDVYELDLDNFTATLSQYHIFYTTYYNGERTIFGNPSNIYMPNYNWVTPVENQFLATSYNDSEVSRIRHAQEGDQEVVYQGGSQQYTLDEYSLILERVDADDTNGGTNSGYNAMVNRFYIKDGEGNRRVATFTYNNGKLFWLFNEGTSLFESINIGLSSEAVDIFYREYIFYVNDELYFYDGTHKKLYKQTTIENNTIIFDELSINWAIDYVNVYLNDYAKSDEVRTIDCVYNSQLENYELILNDTYHYIGGENWVDAQGDFVDVSNLKITYNYNYAYFADTLIYDLAQLRYYVITTMEQKLNEPLKDKNFGKVAVNTEVADDLEEDTEYSFKTNMDFSEDDINLLMSISNNTYIYYDEDNYKSIRFINNDGEIGIEYTDDGSEYVYIIYSESSKISGWINEWLGGEVPDSFYLHLDCINPTNEECTTMMKRILNVGTHTETTLKEISLDEKIKDLPNWQYESKIGILTIPQWDYTYEWSGSYYNFYEDDDNGVSVTFNNFPVRGYQIYDYANNTGYMICEEDYAYGPDFTVKANVWYKYSLPNSKVAPEQCDTPNITLDTKYLHTPNFIDFYNGIYGENSISLKEKLDNLNPKLGPLKDMLYDYIQEELEEGKEYSLTDNYDSFFEKYGNGQSTLIYSAMNNDEPVIEPGLDNGGMLALNINNDNVSTNSISNDEPVQTRDGAAMLDPGVDAPVNIEMPTILSIYLYTDSTPSPTPIKNGELAKGGDYMSIEDPGTSLLGGASLEVYTSQGLLTFNQGGNSWYYGDTSISLNQVPPLILNKSYIKDEQMLKDFLQLEDKSQTLKEKIDEVENAPLIDKIYSYKLVDCKPLFNPSYDTLEALFSNIGDGQTITIYDSPELIISAYYSWGRYYNTEEVYWKINNVDYTFNRGDNVWLDSNSNTITSQEDLPDIVFKEAYIVSDYENIVKGLIYLVEEKPTLGEKIADIKNWTYETVKANLVSGQTYNFLDSYSDDFFTKYDDLFSSGWGTLIYGASDGIAPTAPYCYISLCYIEVFDNTYKLIAYEGNDGETDILSGYIYNGEYSGWYELSWGDNNYELVIEDDSPVPVETPSTLGFNTGLILDESVVKDLFGLTDTIVTISDKVDGLLKDKIYDNISVLNTFKPLLKMTPATLLPATGSATTQDISLYDDSNNGISFTYHYVHESGWNAWYHNIVYINGDNTYTFRINDSLPFKYIYIWIYDNSQVTSQDVLPSFVYNDTLVNPTYKAYFESLIYQITTPQSLEEKLDSLVASFNANVPVAAWDTTTDASIAAVYPYQATIQSDYLVNTIKCEAEFSLADQISGNYAAFYNFDDTAHEVIVYAKEVPADTVSVKITRWLGSKLPDITISAN